MINLEISHLQKKYGNKLTIDIDALSIKESGIIGIVGNNGAGKTTLFRLLLDLIQPSAGEISINGINVVQSEHWKDFTASFIDNRFLIDFLTAEEFFLFVGKIYQLTPTLIQSKLESYATLFNGEILNQQGKLIRDFSKGNQQKIGIVSTLLTGANLIILDEPFDGLDPTSQIVLKELLKEYVVQNQAIIWVSSHDLNHIVDICGRIILMEKGKIIKDLVNEKDAQAVLENYFGVASAI